MESKTKEKALEDLPNLIDKQIKIIDFWKIRGYENITHCLGMNISLHKKDRYAHLGIDLQYLEQFYNQIVQENTKKLFEKIDSLPKYKLDGDYDNIVLSESKQGVWIKAEDCKELKKQLKEGGG